MHILLLHIYLNTMFEFSCLLTHCQSQFHLIFNHFGFFFVVWTKVHEIASNFYHCVIYTGMHSILLCLYLAFFTYPLFIDLLRLASHNMTFKEDKQGRKELQPNFYIFLKQIFFQFFILLHSFSL